MRLRTEIDIEAPLERVWGILADLARYPEWNPFTHRVDGVLSVGEKLRLHVRLGGREMQRTHVLSRCEENAALCWTIRSRQPWLIRGERSQTVASLGAERTRYVNVEVVEGLSGFFVGLGYSRQIEAGLLEVGRALKARAELAHRQV
jgi:hypothetical protein